MLLFVFLVVDNDEVAEVGVVGERGLWLLFLGVDTSGEVVAVLLLLLAKLGIS